MEYLPYSELRDKLRAEESRYRERVAERLAEARALQSTDGSKNDRLRAELTLLERCRDDAAEHERRIDEIYASLAPELQFKPLEYDEHAWLEREPVAVPLESL